MRKKNHVLEKGMFEMHWEPCAYVKIHVKSVSSQSSNAVYNTFLENSLDR